MAQSERSLDPFFAPRAVLIVGAATDPTKLGYGLARNLLQSGYPGSVALVNPKGGHLLGHPLLADIATAPGPLDLALLLIPAQAVPQALRQCGERGVKGAVILSGGFSESGPHGAVLEQECLQIARQYGISLLGPNCVGLADTHYPLNATFLPPPAPQPGEIAFLSHSGAMCNVVIDGLRARGIGLSRLVSLGNQVDVNETDVLDPTCADPFTRVILMYLETVRDGERFVRELTRLNRQKPFVILKVGRSSSGQRAAASHTGALAGQENAYQAAFRRAGAIRADTMEECFDFARALAWCPLPAGRAVAVLSNAGGPAVLSADAVDANGLHLADLSAATLQALQALLPPAASLGNPVDMLASASPEQYAAALRGLLSDPGVDSVIVVVVPPPMFSAGAVAKALVPVIVTAAKPVLVTLVGDAMIGEAVQHLQIDHVVEVRFPEKAAAVLKALSLRAEFLAQSQEPPLELHHPFQNEAGHRSSFARVKRLLDQPDLPEFLPAETLSQILQAYGIPVVSIHLAGTPQEALALAKEMGLGRSPAAFALKVASPDILHKSDVGGVLLNLKEEQSILDGFDTVLERARLALPQATFQGVYVQRMALPAQEVIAGAVRDAQFGPLVMFGSGGVEVEGLQDVAFSLAPLTRADAEFLLENTWAGRRLYGYRNLPPGDRAAVLDLLYRLALLVYDFPQLAEVEINPLRVYPTGQGVLALDFRARLRAGNP